MATDTDDIREQGIEFGGLIGDLEDESYPLSHETLLSRYGDHELGLFDTQVPLREVLPSEQEREYEELASVQQAVFNMVDDEAAGEKGTPIVGGMPPMTTRLSRNRSNPPCHSRTQRV